MKKIISMVLTVAMLLSMTAAYVSADDLVSHEADFETPESYSWADQSDGTTATIAYGSNANNTAYMLTTSKKFGSLSVPYGDNLKTYPVEGLSTFVLDFYPESTSFASHEQYSDYKFARLYTDSGDRYVWQFIKNNNTSIGVAPMGDFAKKVNVNLDTWTRLILVYNPATGLGDFTVVKNVDTNPEATTITGVTVTAANETKIDRLFIYSYRGETVYLDNVAVKEIPAVLAQSSATPANGATDADAAAGASLTFNNNIASANLKVNGTAANFAVSGATVTYSGALEAETSYTITGMVADVYGMVYSVNHSFTTAAESAGGGDEPGDDETLISYTADFETAASYEWLNNPTGSTATLAYGSNANNTAYMLSNDTKIGNYEFGTYFENPVTGVAVYSIDMYPESTSFASHDNYSDYNFASMNTDAGAVAIWRFIKNANNTLGISPMGDFAVKANVNFDTWTRLILVYDPATGLGDFTVVKNVDTNPVETTYPGITVTAANQTKIKRVYLYSYRQDTVYVDNISLGQKPAALAQTDATPANGATNVALDTAVSFTFDSAVASADLKVNGAAANFAVSGSTVTYTGTLAANTTYTVTGTVTGENGAAATVNHSFTTVRGPLSYSADFEDNTYTSWASLTYTDSNGASTDEWSQVVTKAYGSDADNKAVALKSGANYLAERGNFDTLAYGTVVDNPILGNAVVTLDFMIDSASKTSWDIPRALDTVKVQVKGTSASSSKTIFKYQRVEEDSFRVILGNDSELGFIELDTWNRLTMSFNPTTGKADFALITNVDTATQEVYTAPDYQLTAGGDLGIDRITMNTLYDNLLFYYDNIELREQNVLLTYGNARFVDGSDVEITDGKSVAAPVFKADVTNNTDAPEKVMVVVTATKDGRIEEMAIQTVTVAAGESTTVSKGFEMADASGYEVKGFLIRAHSIKPLVDAITLEAR